MRECVDACIQDNITHSPDQAYRASHGCSYAEAMQGAKKTYRSGKVFCDVVKIGLIKKRSHLKIFLKNKKHTLFARLYEYAAVAGVTLKDLHDDENACKTSHDEGTPCTVNFRDKNGSLLDFLILVLHNECGGSGNGRKYELLLYNNEGEFKSITLDGAAWSTDINITTSFHTSKVREFVSIVLSKLQSWVNDDFRFVVH